MIKRMKQRTPGRTTVIFILLTFVGSIRPLQRPTKSKNISFNFNPSSAPIRQIQPKVVRFDVNYFAVVDAEDLLRITIYYQSWLKSDTLTFNISQGINDFAAIPAPNNSIMVIMSEENYRAIIVDKEGQITYDGAISNLFTPDFVNVCQITEDLFALVERGADQTDLKLRVYDYNFNLIDSLSRSAFDINVASDGTYLYYGVLPNEAASAASVFKVNPKNLTQVFASIDNLAMQETNSILLSVLGNQLMVTRVGASTGRIYWTLLDLASNLEILAARGEKNYSSPDQLIPLMNPAYTNEGYLSIAQKIDNNPWIETSMHPVTLKTIANYTLWGVTNSQMPTTLTSRYYLDINRNGYIIPMKDFDPTENKSIISLQFYGDVCGDGIVSGAEQCDGGEFCKMNCQCQSGSRPTSPLSNDCVLDTSFTNCMSCPYDTTICLEERRSCAQYRVVPILQCIQTMPFGAKRAVFSYNARIASRIEPVTSNNIITPHGTPTKDFTSGRSYIYPASSFTVDYAANTNVEWFVDGQSLSFNTSDPTLACHTYISVQVQSDQQTNMTGFIEDLTQTFAKLIEISETRLTAVEVSSKKRQTTALVQVNIAGDPVSDPYAVDAAQTLLNNIAEVHIQLPAVRSISPILSTREIQGVVIGPGIPITTQSPSPDPVIEPTTNSPVNDVPAGWSNNYIAIIVCVPIGVGVIIFLGVFFARKKKAKKPQKIDKIPLGALSASSNYTSVPDMSPFSTARSDTALLDGISPRPVDRLHVPYEELKFKTELGAGAYGKVFIGEWQRTKVALKINTSATGDDFAREARLMVELRPHPNVVQMLGVSSDGPYPVMILEFCDGGSLDDKLFTMSEVITPQQQLEIVLGIAKGLYHLHKNQIVHRDLAARNILLNHNTPKISDFGLSRQVGEQQKGTTKSTVGPVRWMAPESLKHMTYSTKSDVWTFGVVVCEIVSRQEPHKDADPMAIGLNIRDNGAIPEIPHDCDPALKALMEKCWQADPDKRPTMEQICDILDRYMEEMSAQQ